MAANLIVFKKLKAIFSLSYKKNKITQYVLNKKVIHDIFALSQFIAL